MQAYSLIKYSDNYLKTSGSLQQYCGDEPNNNVTDYELFKFKSKLLDNTNNEGIINAKMAVSLKYLSNFWVTLEIINCEINFILTQIANFIISQRDIVTTFAMTDTKLYALILNLSTQDNTKLLQEMKLGLKRTINWNKYQSIERQKPIFR